MCDGMYEFRTKIYDFCVYYSTNGEFRENGIPWWFEVVVGVVGKVMLYLYEFRVGSCRVEN